MSESQQVVQARDLGLANLLIERFVGEADRAPSAVPVAAADTTLGMAQRQAFDAAAEAVAAAADPAPSAEGFAAAETTLGIAQRQAIDAAAAATVEQCQLTNNMCFATQEPPEATQEPRGPPRAKGDLK